MVHCGMLDGISAGETSGVYFPLDEPWASGVVSFTKDLRCVVWAQFPLCILILPPWDGRLNLRHGGGH